VGGVGSRVKRREAGVELDDRRGGSAEVTDVKEQEADLLRADYSNYST
jgi:hypothetical protein